MDATLGAFKITVSIVSGFVWGVDDVTRYHIRSDLVCGIGDDIRCHFRLFLTRRLNRVSFSGALVTSHTAISGVRFMVWVTSHLSYQVEFSQCGVSVTSHGVISGCF